MSASEQIGKGGFWRRQKESEPDALKNEASNGATPPQESVEVGPATLNAVGATVTETIPASANGTPRH